MKVMVLVRSQSSVPGGAGVPGGQIGMVQLGRALRSLGVDTEILVGGEKMAYLEGLDGLETTHFRWPEWLDRALSACPKPIGALGARLRGQRWLDAVIERQASWGADVIHVQGLSNAEELLDHFGGRLVVTHWGRAGRWRPARGAKHDAALGLRISRLRDEALVVAIGEAQAEELASVGIHATAVIPPGIDVTRFTPGSRSEARRQIGIPEEQKVVLYVGRLAADKNVQTLLRAFATLPAWWTGLARLVIVGDGPLRDSLATLSQELGINANTLFVPFVPHGELPAYYRGCDVTVVPSDRLETFCMVGLEAIACGAALIVSGDVPEILRRFPSVPTVNAADTHELARATEAALDGAVAPAFSPSVLEHDWTGIARRYLPLYRTVIDAKGDERAHVG